MRKRHRELGDFVRIGPNEISISDPSFIPIIHGNKSRFPKGPWYDHMIPDPVKSLIAIRDYDQHKSRRKVWDECFTPRALKVYENRISTVFEGLAACFDDYAKTGEWLDLSLWSERLLVDTIGKIAFVSLSTPCGIHG
jgi:cytochrome P450